MNRLFILFACGLCSAIYAPARLKPFHAGISGTPPIKIDVADNPNKSGSALVTPKPAVVYPNPELAAAITRSETISGIAVVGRQYVSDVFKKYRSPENQGRFNLLFLVDPPSPKKEDASCSSVKPPSGHAQHQCASLFRVSMKYRGKIAESVTAERGKLRLCWAGRIVKFMFEGSTGILNFFAFHFDAPNDQSLLEQLLRQHPKSESCHTDEDSIVPPNVGDLRQQWQELFPDDESGEYAADMEMTSQPDQEMLSP